MTVVPGAGVMGDDASGSFVTAASGSVAGGDLVSGLVAWVVGVDRGGEGVREVKEVGVLGAADVVADVSSDVAAAAAAADEPHFEYVLGERRASSTVEDPGVGEAEAEKSDGVRDLRQGGGREQHDVEKRERRERPARHREESVMAGGFAMPTGKCELIASAGGAVKGSSRLPRTRVFIQRSPVSLLTTTGSTVSRESGSGSGSSLGSGSAEDLAVAIAGPGSAVPSGPAIVPTLMKGHQRDRERERTRHADEDSFPSSNSAAHFDDDKSYAGSMALQSAVIKGHVMRAVGVIRSISFQGNDSDGDSDTAWGQARVQCPYPPQQPEADDSERRGGHSNHHHKLHNPLHHLHRQNAPRDYSPAINVRRAGIDEDRRNARSPVLRVPATNGHGQVKLLDNHASPNTSSDSDTTAVVPINASSEQPDRNRADRLALPKPPQTGHKPTRQSAPIAFGGQRRSLWNGPTRQRRMENKRHTKAAAAQFANAHNAAPVQHVSLMSGQDSGAKKSEQNVAAPANAAMDKYIAFMGVSAEREARNRVNTGNFPSKVMSKAQAFLRRKISSA